MTYNVLSGTLNPTHFTSLHFTDRDQRATTKPSRHLSVNSRTRTIYNILDIGYNMVYS